jgi:deoxyribodipyrimidine photo-lyase
MHVFLFNKSLRIHDNTTLNAQSLLGKIVPIFVFTEQVNPKKNQYFSDHSVQFMVESLEDLKKDIHKQGGELYFFHDDLIDCLHKLHKKAPFDSLGTNFDYSPYARRRTDELVQFCKKNEIEFVCKEDHVMYDILEGQTLKKDKTPYTVFTPFKNNCQKKLKVPSPVYTTIHFMKQPKWNSLRVRDIHDYYTFNPHANITGGRTNGLHILSKLDQFHTYDKERDTFTYSTTFLSAHNHYGTVSIREVYEAAKQNTSIVNELCWRDFYYNLFYTHPYMLGGQIGDINQPFKEKFGKIKWVYDKELFKKWCNGTLGIPVCDAGMRQMNQIGFMHNRLRMITSGVLCKLCRLPWWWGEQYFARTLLDYDCIQNGGGWGWGCHGIDPQQVFRIFSPKLQGESYDKECIYIKKYIPELKDVPNKDIHNWEESHVNYTVYYPPAINYKEARKETLAMLANL